MRDGFIKVAAVTPEVRVADCIFNTASICRGMRAALAEKAKIIVFPELCLTGYTCGDLFWQDTLLWEARHELYHILPQTKGKDALVFIGLPWEKDGKLYNVAAAIYDGRLIGLVPKRYLLNCNEFDEVRHFTPGNEKVEWVKFEGMPVPFGTNQVFCTAKMPEGLTIGVEIGADLWAPNPPSVSHALAGANMIVNLSASDEVTGKSLYRESLIANQSARLLCSYVCAGAGAGESTQDLVFGGHSILAENGHILAESPRFSTGIVYTEFDINRLRAERRRINTFVPRNTEDYERIRFGLVDEDTDLTRTFDQQPFVPFGKEELKKRCEEIFTIQALGLKKRMQHTKCQNTVVGISGGLDSILALLVMTRAHDMLGIPRSQMTAVMLPASDSVRELVKCLGIQISEEPSDGLLIGTTDMTDLAVGSDSESGEYNFVYNVNCSVPKTLVPHLVRYYADTCEDSEVSRILCKVSDSPVRPEIQLYDFFLYYMLRFGYRPGKIYRIAKLAFAGTFDEETILNWMKKFYGRFFALQSKRSCAPDGPKVGSVALSPRGDLRMPSDASVKLWSNELSYYEK